ncbi:STAS-like domain-containing protein [Succinivibrio sp.]|uniref:STAS-like domain-containing protein n=1 Tax=Succinivibrio sp. TaxID=2053619 RepID=UPI00386756B5
METLTIKLPSGSLASRASAVPFRQKIQQGLEEGKTVILDLSDVDVISGSFADECVGVLVKMKGFKTVSTKIKLKYGNGYTEKSIASAILERKNEVEKVKTLADYNFYPA